MAFKHLFGWGKNGGRFSGRVYKDSQLDKNGYHHKQYGLYFGRRHFGVTGVRRNTKGRRHWYPVFFKF